MCSSFHHDSIETTHDGTGQEILAPTDEDLADLRGFHPSRLPYFAAFRKLLDARVALSFGSDYPGEESYAPLLGMHLPVNRADDRAISPEEALACYTSASAYAEFAEESKGRLKVGYLADMAVLEKNPLRVNPSNIKDIDVVETIVGGRTVYRP